MDKIKPLKIENPALGGSETDYFPTEADPLEDYVATKGLAFENLDTYSYEKLGRSLVENYPNGSTKLVYLGDKNVDYVEYFITNTQTTPNRIAKRSYTYNGNKTPATETFLIYASDGTTILRTYLYTFTYTTNNLTNVELAIT